VNIAEIAFKVRCQRSRLHRHQMHFSR